MILALLLALTAIVVALAVVAWVREKDETVQQEFRVYLDALRRVGTGGPGL